MRAPLVLEPRTARWMKRILIVEDDRLFLAFLVSALEAEYEISTARTAEEAVRYVEVGESFDLLITDMVLPGGGRGHQVAWRLTEADPLLPVLIVSAHLSTDDQIQKAVRAPRTAFIGKPFGISELRETVRALLA